MNPDELPSSILASTRAAISRSSTGYLLSWERQLPCALEDPGMSTFQATGHEIKSREEEFTFGGFARFLLLGIYLMSPVLTSRLILAADSTN